MHVIFSNFTKNWSYTVRMVQGQFNADFDTEIENQFLGVQVPHVHVCTVQVNYYTRM